MGAILKSRLHEPKTDVSAKMNFRAGNLLDNESVTRSQSIPVVWKFLPRFAKRLLLPSVRTQLVSDSLQLAKDEFNCCRIRQDPPDDEESRRVFRRVTQEVNELICRGNCRRDEEYSWQIRKLCMPSDSSIL